MRARRSKWSLLLAVTFVGCSSSGGNDDDADDEASMDGDAGGGDATDDDTSPSDADDDAEPGPAPDADDDADDDADPDATDPNATDADDLADDSTEADDDVPIDDAECGSRDVPAQPLRRLSSEEYRRTLLDLFGDDLGRRLVQDSRFPETLIRSGFTADAEANVVNTAESNAIEDNAERIATLIDQDPDAFLVELMPCAMPQTIGDADIDGCIDPFIESFGLRAYRRPLTTSEATIARSVYDGLRSNEPARFAFAGLVQYFVEAPAMLYRVERGAGEPEGELVALSGYERATRLSYLLRGSMPDDELFAAAQAGELESAEQVRAQAERLLAGVGFYDVLDGFHRDWLELHGFEYKETSLFPDFDAVRGSLEEEPRRFVRHVMEAGEGSIEALLGSSTVVVDDALSNYYGIDAAGAAPDTWVTAEAPNRPGIVTRGAVMATLADSTATNPIHRGGFFQTQILCRTLPALPGNLDIQGPLQDTSGLPTARERLAPLLERGECSACHTLINPAGLAFENYDAAGQFRDSENGTTIDASGSLFLDGAEVAFQNAVELMQVVAQSDEARECYTLNWFRAGLGRPEFEQDSCSLAALQAATAASGGDVRELLLALVQTDAFLYRRVEP